MATMATTVTRQKLAQPTNVTNLVMISV